MTQHFCIIPFKEPTRCILFVFTMTENPSSNHNALLLHSLRSSRQSLTFILLAYTIVT